MRGACWPYRRVKAGERTVRWVEAEGLEILLTPQTLVFEAGEVGVPWSWW